MKRITVSIPEDIAAALEREARRRRVPVSQVAREGFAAHLGLAGDKPRKLPFAALGASGKRTTARDLEEVLAAEWTRARRR